MVVTCGNSGGDTGVVSGSGVGDGSGSGSRAWIMDYQMREFISFEITCNILEQTHKIFGAIKEGIMEILDERL